MIIFGKNPVFEATKAGIVHNVYIRKGTALYDIDFNAPVKVLEKGEFDSRFGRETQGIAADIDDIKIYTISELSNEIKASKAMVILDQIQDPHNYGAIIRSAHCFGANLILVPRYHQAPITPTVCKASAGAIFHVKIISETNLNNACNKLKDYKYDIVSLDSEADASLGEYKNNGKVALIVGSEGRGIRDSLMKTSDTILKINMKGVVDSLNASCSASIAMYHLFSNS